MLDLLYGFTRLWSRDASTPVTRPEMKDVTPQPRTPPRLKSNIIIHDSRDARMPGLYAQLRGRISSLEVANGPPAANPKKWWLAVRGFPMGFHTLSEGDLIKIGRSKFRVRELSMGPTAVGHEKAWNYSHAFQCTSVCDEDANNMCRICLSEGSEHDDPLVAPCRCKGTIECVHIGCLQHWTKGRFCKLQGVGGSFSYKPPSCELCKTPLPSHVQVGNQQRQLVDVPTIQGPHVVLETMTGKLHVVALADGKVARVGRSRSSDVCIADGAVSRHHATIRFSEGKFLLADDDSELGTHVAVDHEQHSIISSQAGDEDSEEVVSI